MGPCDSLSGARIIGPVGKQPLNNGTRRKKSSGVHSGTGRGRLGPLPCITGNQIPLPEGPSSALAGARCIHPTQCFTGLRSSIQQGAVMAGRTESFCQRPSILNPSCKGGKKILMGHAKFQRHAKAFVVTEPNHSRRSAAAIAALRACESKAIAPPWKTATRRRGTGWGGCFIGRSVWIDHALLESGASSASMASTGSLTCVVA